MKAFHGCVLHKAERLINAIELQAEKPVSGLDSSYYVTDTRARATRYANAQASGDVNLSLEQTLATYGCLIEVEIPESEFLTRGAAYRGSLDAVELIARIPQSRITRVTVRPAAYRNCSSHKTIARLRDLLGDRLEVLDA